MILISYFIIYHLTSKLQERSEIFIYTVGWKKVMHLLIEHLENSIEEAILDEFTNRKISTETDVQIWILFYSTITSFTSE